MVLVAAVPGLWLTGSGPTENPQRHREGQIHIASVENNHTKRAGVVVFTVTDEEGLVEGTASTIPPGAVRDYGLIDCRDGDLVATQLRIQVDLGMEDGYTSSGSSSSRRGTAGMVEVRCSG